VSASFDCHIPEELLDEFVMEMLSEQDYAFWEEHLLICATCQVRLAQADEYVRVIKSAAAKLRTGGSDLGLDSDAVAMAGEI
jgi:hypothetical protein